ncbi:13065_t:CDS:2 [Dentiscutata heterogama]|uniref:13065_t:CDS:1 n=1 Tax=Dentiscutata heterogama TaxID=1316150 RepID=A0ACA9MZP8_9GLOM|nr:13065_t:CDS:2 [Dentiscutata heterogama]
MIPLLCLNYIEAARDVKVRLEDVKTITLYRGELTAGQRNNPIEQLRCVGGDACHMYTPDVIQCTNTGSDGLDVNWRCNAELPDYLKFGPVCFIISETSLKVPHTNA